MAENPGEGFQVDCVVRTYTEESATESAEWIGEDTEESASEEEAETTGGRGWVGNTLTETAVASEGSGVENGPQGATDDGGGTPDATPKDADASGAGGGAMGRGKGTGRRLPARGKTRMTSTPEWEKYRGGGGLRIGRKPRGGFSGSGREGQISKGSQHPRIGRVSPG